MTYPRSSNSLVHTIRPWLTVTAVLTVAMTVTAAVTTTVPPPVDEPLGTIYPTPVAVEDAAYWRQVAQNELTAALGVTPNTNVAKNVILFLGDGMGVPTITAARIYKGQTQSAVSGEEGLLSFESFPNVALSKTYCVDKQVSDSAATATAFLTGVKTKDELVGVDQSVVTGDCDTVTEENKVSSIAQWALDADKRAGFVTSTRVTHATPSATYAHSAHRDWECDQEIDALGKPCLNHKDIARQLVEDEPGRSFHVIMGGGEQYLRANATDRPGDPVNLNKCNRQDNRDLIQQWKDDRTAEGKSWASALTRTELMEQDLSNVDYFMGIYANGHVPFENEKIEQSLDLPTLAEMTEKAIDILSKGDQGYFLLVEGGRIDHAHHDNTATKALDETVAFDAAIIKALGKVDTEETLLVVTADHSHVMTINGYPERGQDITGLASISDDDLPFTTLMYTNGPGFSYLVYNDTAVGRNNLTDENVTDIEYLQQSAVFRDSETHGGEDVSIYAIGPMAHLFHGVHEQNYIAHVMGYAACIGANTDHCATTTTTVAPPAKTNPPTSTTTDAGTAKTNPPTSTTTDAGTVLSLSPTLLIVAAIVRVYTAIW